MADIELIIKIPIEETIEENSKAYFDYFGCMSKKLYATLKNGTPLPKGHKIIDATALQEHLALVPMEDRTFRETVDIIDWFPSIIEADKESEDT